MRACFRSDVIRRAAQRARDKLGWSWGMSRLLLNPRDDLLFEFQRKRTTVRLLGFESSIVMSAVLCLASCVLVFVVHGSIDTLYFALLFGLSVGMYISWAINIAAVLARVREGGTYETLAVIPEGAQGVDWAFCMGTLHNNDTIHWVYDSRLILIFVAAFSGIFSLITTSFNARVGSLFEVVAIILLLALLCLFAYVDQVQALVLSTLTGMFVPHYTYSGMDSRLWSAGLFLISQLFPFLLAVWVDRSLSPTQSGGMLGLLGGMLAFYACREVIIRVLWWRLSVLWNTNPHEV